MMVFPMSGWLVFLFLFFSSVYTTESREITDLNEKNSVSSPHMTTVALCLSGLAFLLVGVVLVFKCGDCYNSEVSTEFHPASNGTAPKWGGAAGYSQDNVRGSGGGITFGETYDPNSSQGLPYSMIPTNIPEQGGFAGYQTGSAGDQGAGGAPLTGYQAFNAASAPNSGGGGGGEGRPRHYNPAEAQEPPPTYTESQRHASLRGDR